MGAHLGKSSGCPRRKPIESWYASCQNFRLRQPQFSHQLDLLREPLSAAAFSRSKMKPAFDENEISQVTYVEESNSTPANVPQLTHETVRNDWRDEMTDVAVGWLHTSSRPSHDPICSAPSWFSAPPGLTLQIVFSCR